MKEIALFSAVFPPEPVVSAKITFDIAVELSKKHNVTVICPIPSRPFGFKFEKQHQTLPFNVFQVNSYTSPESKVFSRIRESISFGQKCSQYIKNNHHNIGLIYMNVWPLFSQRYILNAAKKYGIKVITHIQDIYPESFTNKLPIPARQLFRWLLKPIDQYILQNSDLVIAISEKMKEYLSKTRSVSPKKIEVVINWQDENAFIDYQSDQNNMGQNHELTFMYLGNIGPVAGVELLIESFGKAVVPNSRLIIAGSGSMKAPCEILSQNYPNAKIQFTEVPAGKVPEVQAQADVMLLPIKKGAAMSSIPSKLPAYMFSKKPIIACVDKNSDTSESIIQSECGWVIDPESESQLIQMFRAISIEDRKKIEEKGEKGFDYAMKRFSKKSNLKNITTILTNLYSSSTKPIVNPK